MAVAKVLRLEEYRDRRQDRLNLADAMYGVDWGRHRILRHLGELAELSGADRVAAVWVDEYGPGLVHPFVVLDLLADNPRRVFPPAPLREAWEIGVPGTHDGGGDLERANLAIALGSDGTRSWFLVSDSLAPRPRLAPGVRERLMFLAGECSAIVLHRDLDGVTPEERGADERRFPGWAILKDLEGREDDEVESRRIALRFVVGRLVRMLVDDDLAIPPERLAEQVRRARAELVPDVGLSGPEQQLWLQLLEAYQAERHGVMAATLVELGEMAEARDHNNGALEMYGCAYEIGIAVRDERTSAHAARLKGRLLRRRASWEEAGMWYEAARAIADAVGLDDLVARALSGLAVMKRDQGNLPAARERLAEARGRAERSGDRDTIATVFSELMGVEHAAGDLEAALRYGWVAATTFESPVSRIRSLATLAGALSDWGDLVAAEDAWTVVAHRSNEAFYRAYAHDALAHLAALRGDGATFDEQARLCDALNWEHGPKSAKAEILYYRGLSCRALGRLDAAASWLTRAVDFAEEHGFNQVLFKAEEERASLTSIFERRLAAGAPAAPRDVREGVRAMRQELVGV